MPLFNEMSGRIFARYGLIGGRGALIFGGLWYLHRDMNLSALNVTMEALPYPQRQTGQAFQWIVEGDRAHGLGRAYDQRARIAISETGVLSAQWLTPQ